MGPIPSGETTLPPVVTEVPPQNRSRNLPYVKNVSSVSNSEPKAEIPSRNEHAFAPTVEPGNPNILTPVRSGQHPTDRFGQPLAFDRTPPFETQTQRASNLENELRNMILSHEPSAGHQRTPSSNTSHPSPLPQAQSTQTHSNRRRPNQPQRKQQAQQMQMSLQHPPLASDRSNPHQIRPSQYYGQHHMKSQPMSHQQPTVNPQPYHGYQQDPPGAFIQPRTLFNPNSGADPRRGGGPLPRLHVVDVQTQIRYIDHLARIKIPQVEMSPEECDKKQMLKQSLNDICCKVVCKHELQTNLEFPIGSVELKSFGSLSIGFATKDSDMDLTLVSPASKPSLSTSESEIPAKIEEALMELGYGARLLTKTRVPIIKFCEKPSPVLALHLRLTRLFWEKERDLGLGQVDLELPEDRPEVAKGAELSTEKRNEEPNSSNQSFDPSMPPELEKLPSSKLSEAAQPSTEPQKGKMPNRRERKFDPAWLTRLSTYESIGLLQIILKEGRGTPLQRSLISNSLKILDNSSDPQSPPEFLETLTKIPELVAEIGPPSREALEFPKSGVGTQCDINFSNQLALHNSLLLKCYSLCDPRVRQMVLFVKAWTKIRKINSPYHGTLNSYGYVLMVLHFLMNVAQPPVLPNLQLAKEMIENDPLSFREATFEGHNVQFFRNEVAIEEMARNGVFGQNKETLGSLLRGFFQFYANPPFGTFSWKDDVLSLRTRGGVLTKVGKGWTGAKVEMVDMAGPGPDQKKVNHRYVVAIEDPFETEHNVARTVYFNGVVAIRDEFRRAVDLILRGGVDPRLGPQDFFAEGKNKEHLQKRNDGPRSKNAGPKTDASPSSISTKQSTPSKAVAVQKQSQIASVHPTVSAGTAATNP